MNILINGDSWGCGEWGTPGTENIVKNRNLPGLGHLGIEHYFQEKGYLVKNLSEGGSNNALMCDRFEQEDLSQYDYIFCFQTDHVRELDHRFLTENNTKKITWDRFIEHQKIRLEEFYQRLNGYGKTIYLLGGVNKINLDIIKRYPNVVPIVPSVVEFITPQFGEHNDLWWGQWILSIPHSYYDSDCLERIVDNKEHYRYVMDPDFKKYYWPDGKHPNRLGHKVIFDYLCSQLGI